jgi:hypothetical protein
MIHPIRDGDQYIIPESSMTWLDLLRFDWLKSKDEEPRYFEEMSRERDEKDNTEIKETPHNRWVEHYGNDNKQLRIQWSNQPDTPLVPLMPFMGMSILDWGIDSSLKGLEVRDLKDFARKTKRSVGYIEFTEGKYEDPHTIYVKRKTEQEHVVLFVKIDGKFGLLMEEDRTYLPIDRLPQQIQREWKEAPITQLMTKPQVAEVHTTSVPTVQPMMANVKEKEPPLVKKKFQHIKKPGVEEPLPAPVVAPVAESVQKKIRKPLTKPAVEEPLPAPVAEPVAAPVAESVQKKIRKPLTKPAVEEPLPAPVAEPVAPVIPLRFRKPLTKPEVEKSNEPPKVVSMKIKKPLTKPGVEESSSAQLGGHRTLHVLSVKK